MNKIDSERRFMHERPEPTTNPPIILPIDLEGKGINKNDLLYTRCLASIKELYSDLSVGQEECYENLKSLIKEIKMLLETLRVNEE